MNHQRQHIPQQSKIPSLSGKGEDLIPEGVLRYTPEETKKPGDKGSKG